MFLNLQQPNTKKEYIRYLSVASSLSKLFSDSLVPYLDYRLVENLFCKAFDASNVSRLDVSVDAVKETIGIGVKTFTAKKNGSFEKIAEFNRLHASYSGLSDEDKVLKIAEYRNQRITATSSIYGLTNMLYHVVLRKEGAVAVFETPLRSIDIHHINAVTRKRNSISFNDGQNEYRFSNSKSVLYQYFSADRHEIEFPIEILDDPLNILTSLIAISEVDMNPQEDSMTDYVYLPLYSTRKTATREVAKKSGLNQWNACGRDRHPDEVYIPVPVAIHRKFPRFFPRSDVSFNLILPNRNVLKAKLCQDNDKGLMSDPNKDLGKWILRDILQVAEGELVTYEKLVEIGLDSVIIRKIDASNYSIDFAPLDSYSQFIAENE